jgi:hypothetical protein
MAAMISQEGDLAEANALLRSHPRWAIWLPVGSSDWAAIRPASSQPPSPELPTIWVHAATPSELARLMRRADEQVSVVMASPASPNLQTPTWPGIAQ